MDVTLIRRSITKAISVTQSQNRVKMNRGNAPAPDPRLAYFETLAPRWDATGPDPAATRDRVRELAPRLRLRPGLDLIEVGCGTGQLTGWLVEQVRPGRVVAVDFSRAMLERARARGVAAEFREVDICAPPSLAGAFDVALCFHAFPHFRDPAAALRHLRGLLKPTGRLLVVHLAGSAALNAFHARLGRAVAHDRLPPAAEWPALLQAAGLRLRHIEDRDDLFLMEAARAE